VAIAIGITAMTIKLEKTLELGGVKAFFNEPAATEIADDWVSQRVIDEPFHEGVLLSVEWARALEVGPDGERFLGLVKDYVAYLQGRDSISIDLTPSNIVIDAAGGYHAFDEEWRTREPVELAFLLFRSLMMLVVKSEQAARAYARREGLETVETFIGHVGEQVGVNLRERFERVSLAFGDTLLVQGPPRPMQALFSQRDFINLSEPKQRSLRR